MLEMVRAVRHLVDAVPQAIVERIAKNAQFAVVDAVNEVPQIIRERVKWRTIFMQIGSGLLVAIAGFALAWWLRGAMVKDARWLGELAAVNDLAARHRQCEATMRQDRGGYACTVDFWVQLPPAKSPAR